MDAGHPRVYVPTTYEEYRKLRLSTNLHAGEALDHISYIGWNMLKEYIRFTWVCPDYILGVRPFDREDVTTSSGKLRRERRGLNRHHQDGRAMVDGCHSHRPTVVLTVRMWHGHGRRSAKRHEPQGETASSGLVAVRGEANGFKRQGRDPRGATSANHCSVSKGE
ncbi:hypothetical protein OSB04_027530 [Centaurea solstitialis]|uniref:Uncharacterized protein n=1 Tax=Centaurea solstitialis TaxID=347529 RepID=A0AA38W8D4_9ASTR|nr:hypothetical protein OSB04_027530 [Centaurea solstitialis]